jgi:excisionase family DNA binding protein
MTSNNTLAAISSGTSPFWALQQTCHQLRCVICIRVSTPDIKALMSQIAIGKQLHAALPAMKVLATLPDDILADTPRGRSLRLQHGVVPIHRRDASDHAKSPGKTIGYAIATGPRDMVAFVHDTAGKANVWVPGDVLPRIAFTELLLQLMKNYPQLDSIHVNDFKRLARDAASAQQLFSGARYFGVDLFVGGSKVDLSSNSGRLMAGIESNQAAEERTASDDRLTVGRLNALHSGGNGAPPAWHLAQALMPLGYGPILDEHDRPTTRSGGNKRWKLIAPDTAEVDAVRQMLRLVAQGEPWGDCGAPLVDAAVRRRGTKVPAGTTFAKVSREGLAAFVTDVVSTPHYRHLWLTGRYRTRLPMPSANDGTFYGYVVEQQHGGFGHVNVDVEFGLPPGGFVDLQTLESIEARLLRKAPKIATKSETCALFTHAPPYDITGADGSVQAERRVTRVGLSYSLRERPVTESYDEAGRRRGWYSGEGSPLATVGRDVLERSVADAVAKAVHDLDDQKLGIDLSAVRLSEHDAARLTKADGLEKSAKDAEQEGMLSDTLARQAANPDSSDPAGMTRHMSAASESFRKAELLRERAAGLRDEVERSRSVAQESVEADLSTVAAVAGTLRGYAGKSVPIQVNRALMKVGLDTLRLGPGLNETTVEWSLRLELPLVDGDTAHVPVSGIVHNVRRDNKGAKTRMVQDAMAEQFLRNGRSIEELMTTFGKNRAHVVNGLRRYAERNGVKGRGKRSAIVDIPAEMTEVRTLLWEHLSGAPGSSKHLSRLEPLVVPPFLDGQSYPNGFVMHDTTLIRTVLRAMLDAGPDAVRDGFTLTSLARSVGASKTEVSALASNPRQDAPDGPWRVLARDLVNPEVVRLRECPHADCEGAPGARWLSYYLPVPFTMAYAGLACPSCRRVPDPDHARAYLPDSFFDWWNAPEGTRLADLKVQAVTQRTQADDYLPSASIPRGGRLFNLNEAAGKLGITYDALYKWVKSDDPDKPVVQRVASRGKGGMKYVLTIEELQRVEGAERLEELRLLAARNDTPDTGLISLAQLSNAIGVHEFYLRDLALAGRLGPIDRRPGLAGRAAVMLERDAVLNPLNPSEGTALLSKDWIARHRKDLILIADAATRTGCPQHVIRKACDDGELACVTTDGGTRRFDAEELDLWVKSIGEATLTTKQASARTGLHGDVLRAAVRSGELAARVTSGGHRRFDPAQLDLFLVERAKANSSCPQ